MSGALQAIYQNHRGFVLPQSYWLGYLSGNVGYGVAADSSGNMSLCGVSGAPQDIQVAKYNTSGTIQWQRKLNEGSSDYGRAVATDSSGNMYICGDTQNNQIQIVKYNTSGTLQWKNVLYNSYVARGYGIAVDSSGNVYVCGLFDYLGGGYRLAVAKYNTSGTLQWNYFIDDSGTGGGYGVAVDSSANVYVCGYSSDSLYTAKFNTSGTLQWQKRLGSSAAANYGVAVDSSGNVYVCGYAYPSGSNLYISKYNTSGTLQWQRSLGTSFTYGFAVAVDSSANVYVCGYSSANFQIAKYNTSGTIQWQRSLSGSNSMAGQSIAIDSFGSMYITGLLNDSSLGNRFFFAKLPGDGSLTGTYTVGAYSITYAASTLTDAAGVLSDIGVSSTRGNSTLFDTTSGATDSATSLTSVVTTI
jgi:uncharacterized delta-60 repeat protein